MPRLPRFGFCQGNFATYPMSSDFPVSCRSLLAGDSRYCQLASVPRRLQAGSYTQIKAEPSRSFPANYANSRENQSGNPDFEFLWDSFFASIRVIRGQPYWSFSS